MGFQVLCRVHLFRETERLWENWLIAKTTFPSPQCDMSCARLVQRDRGVAALEPPTIDTAPAEVVPVASNGQNQANMILAQNLDQCNKLHSKSNAEAKVMAAKGMERATEFQQMAGEAMKRAAADGEKAD